MALFVLRCIHIYQHVLEKIRAPVWVDHLGVHWQKCPEDGVHVQGWWGCARRWLRCTGWWWWWRWWCRRWCRFAWLAHWVQEGNRAPCYTGQRKHSGPHKGLTGMAALPRLSDSWKGDHEMSKPCLLLVRSMNNLSRIAKNESPIKYLTLEGQGYAQCPPP